MPNKRYKIKKAQQQRIAKKRINYLFQVAKEYFKEDGRLSDKYVRMARRIAMKHKIRLNSLLKRQICKNCHKYLVLGVNSRVRLHKSRLIYYCMSCRHYTRQPVK